MNSNSSDVYRSLGVSASKEDVHQAIKNQDKGLYPGAFCKILPDVVGHSPEHCYALHADTAGTKSVLAYLYWRETGDRSVFRGIAQDALIMNLDDLLCVGAVNDFVVSNTISRNAHRVDGEVIQEIIEGYEGVAALVKKYDIDLHLAGGETADEGDLVSTVIAGCTVGVRLKKEQVIDATNIQAGDVIVALSSSGQSIYEDRENSGIGSNGLTAARHVVLDSQYAQKYPEAFSSSLKPDEVFKGSYSLMDPVPQSSLNVGQALLSPTRTYLPVMKEVIAHVGAKALHGVIHNSGGGLTKCIKFGQALHYVKDDPFKLPPLFQLIKESGLMNLQEMNQVFNLGQRLEYYVSEKMADQIIDMAQRYHIEAKVIGHVEVSHDGHNHVTVTHGDLTFDYKA